MKNNRRNRKLYAISVKNYLRAALNESKDKSNPGPAIRFAYAKANHRFKVSVLNINDPSKNCIVYYDHSTFKFKVTNKQSSVL